MQSKATSVTQYLAELPADRRSALRAVRKVILDNLDDDFKEGMSYGMIGYYVPHSVYPPGYHCDPKQPLPYAGLASQKGHMSLYLMFVYANSAEEKWLRNRWTKAGKKLDMGKCCIRFKSLDDVPLDVIGEAIRRNGVKTFIGFYESTMKSMSKAATAKTARASTGRAARKKSGRKSMAAGSRP